jgi:outer membrane protein assembly factor BamB
MKRIASKSNALVSLNLAISLLATAFIAQASDWPQWRGPKRNGLSQETGLLKEWPMDGPKLLWHLNDVGMGYSTPSVVGDRLYLLGNQGLDNEFVQARAVKDGKLIWTAHLGKVGNPDQQPPFPAARSTPTVVGDVLYALGSDGDLVCVELRDGKVRWHKNLRTDFGGQPGVWAYSESPLVDGDHVICSPGGAEATLVALNRKTGDVVWKAALSGGSKAAYSSIIIVEAGGEKQYVQLVEKGLVGVEAKTGKVLWHYEKLVSPYAANIPTPVAHDNMVYSGVAGKGGGLVKLKAEGGKIEPEEVYFSPKLPTAIGGAVKVGNFLYGTSQTLQCIDFASGNVKWEDRSVGTGALCYADGRLYLHGENGEVALVESTPDGYHEKGRFAPPDQPKRINQMEKAWAYPVVDNGRLYIRDADRLWCYDIRG